MSSRAAQDRSVWKSMGEAFVLLLLVMMIMMMVLVFGSHMH